MNRALVLGGAVFALLGFCAMILAGGRALTPPPVQFEEIADDALAFPDGVVAGDEQSPDGPAEMPGVTVSTRLVAPADVAPPPLEPSQLQRAPPRAPLSPLSQALPPKPEMPDEWKGTTLFQPVATAAGSIEAKGRSIVMAGIEPIAPDETCGEASVAWPCGARARAAFRAMLRGRAVTCTIPPQAERAAIVAPCRVGKVDLGGWLVDNGWARARADGPYADAGKAAQEGRKGIFGAAPETSVPALSVTGSTLAAPPVPDAVLAPEPAVPALAEPAPDGSAFPPAPIDPAFPPAP